MASQTTALSPPMIQQSYANNKHATSIFPSFHLDPKSGYANMGFYRNNDFRPTPPSSSLSSSTHSSKNTSPIATPLTQSPMQSVTTRPFVTHRPRQMHSVSRSTSRRKTTVPSRSIVLPSQQNVSEDDKKAMGIVKLDIYSLLKEQPSKLLFDKELRKKILMVMRKEDEELCNNNGGFGNFDGWSANNAATTVVVKRRVGRPPKAKNRGGQSGASNANGKENDDACNVGDKRKRTGSYVIGSGSNSNANTANGNSAKRRMSTNGRPTPYTGPLILADWLSEYKDTSKAPVISWKGDPLELSCEEEGFSELTPEELRTCQVLRLFPNQYFEMKMALLGAWRTQGHYTKTAAQKMCRVDVNKTGKLYDWFTSIGWMNN